ncbi:hypothetical protein LWI29_022508 [Acer saccharum]|uniref:Peripheral subunit-binding (PSBD) domain-containing protein n=1 Tax=Acer saccharum TaxID=4024 RepID=A0AA39TGW9_ACESA|nr:hypothetical protein LWI29_022508 [Acer saccharum]
MLSNSKVSKNTKGGALSTLAVWHLAKKYGIDLNDVHEIGKNGRVLKEDVLKYVEGIVEGLSISTDFNAPLWDEENVRYAFAEVKYQPNDKSFLTYSFCEVSAYKGDEDQHLKVFDLIPL